MLESRIPSLGDFGNSHDVNMHKEVAPQGDDDDDDYDSQRISFFSVIIRNLL